MKKIIIFFILTTYIFAFNINESLLNIHANIVPKIALMDYNFEDKINNNKITIVIYYTKTDYKSAKLLQDKMYKRYNNGINKYVLNVKLISYTNKKNIKANIYYLLPSSDKNLKEVLKYASDNSVIVFSYSSDSLSKGSMISLDINKKVKPIINLNAINASHISLRSILLKISTIYKNKEVF